MATYLSLGFPSNLGEIDTNGRDYLTNGAILNLFKKRDSRNQFI